MVTWNNSARSSGTVPGPFDVAFYAASNITSVDITQGASLEEIVFNRGRCPRFTALPGSGVGLIIGIENDSGVEQNFVATADGSNSWSFTFFQEFTGRGDNHRACDLYPASAGMQTLGVRRATCIFSSRVQATRLFTTSGRASRAGSEDGPISLPLARRPNAATIINEGATTAGAVGEFLQQKPSATDSAFANGGTNGGGAGFSFVRGRFVRWDSPAGGSRQRLHGHEQSYRSQPLDRLDRRRDGPIYPVRLRLWSAATTRAPDLFLVCFIPAAQSGGGRRRLVNKDRHRHIDPERRQSLHRRNDGDCGHLSREITRPARDCTGAV